MRKRSVILVAVAAALAVGAVTYFARGDRYRLYTSVYARHCWKAVRQLAVSSSSLRPARIATTGSSDEGLLRVDIGYRADRVLAGALLEATCIYSEGERSASAIELGGRPIDAETLARINAELEG